LQRPPFPESFHKHRGLRAGVPLVCVPMGRDQGDVAARVAWHGVSVAPGAAPDELRADIGRVLGEPSFRDAARRMATEMGHEPGSRAVDELQALACPRPEATGVHRESGAPPEPRGGRQEGTL